MKTLKDVVLEVHDTDAGGHLVLRADTFTTAAVWLTPDDAAALAGRLLIVAGAAGHPGGNPFEATLEVLRRGFDVFLERLALDAERAAGLAMVGADLSDRVEANPAADAHARTDFGVDCPKCGSAAGDRCIYPSGRYLPAGEVHAARTKAAAQ